MEQKDKTIAQEALELLEPIPHDKWTSLHYWDGRDCCCLIGHIRRLSSVDPTDYERSLRDTKFSYDFRQIANRYLCKVVLVGENEGIGAYSVNDTQEVNGYNEPEIKDRVIHFIKDMVNAGL